jgi:hypothetical protein
VLTAEQFIQFLVVMGLYRALRCYWSYRDFGTHSVATRGSLAVIAIIYVMYVGAVTQLAREGFMWAQPFVLSGNWSGLVGALSDLIFVKGAILGMLVAGASSYFSGLIADPDLRNDQLEKIRERYANLGSVPAPSREVSEGKQGASA